MALKVADWYDAVRENEVSLRAGARGLERPVCRAHIVERPEFAEFLEGSEIIFVTGVALKDADELTQIIESCREAGAAAVVVNVGRYIRVLPDAAVQSCEAQDFPLFAAPWHVHIELLMQEVFQLLAEDSSERAALEKAFQNAIQFPERQELYAGVLKQYGFETEWHYCVALLQLETPPERDGTLYDQVLQLLRDALAAQDVQGFVYLSGRNLLLIFANTSPEDVEAFLQKASAQIAQQFPSAGRSVFSVGRGTKSIRCLQKTFLLAEKILKLQLCGQLPEGLRAYNRLGIYRMIIGLENQDILNEIHEEYLEPLLEYDRACDTDYVEFVCNYLNCDGRVQELAEKMFVHRNTVHYRIRKIEELLDCDLQRTDTRMYLLIAVMNYQLHTKP